MPTRSAPELSTVAGQRRVGPQPTSGSAGAPRHPSAPEPAGPTLAGLAADGARGSRGRHRVGSRRARGRRELAAQARIRSRARDGSSGIRPDRPGSSVHDHLPAGSAHVCLQPPGKFESARWWRHLRSLFGVTVEYATIDAAQRLERLSADTVRSRRACPRPSRQTRSSRRFPTSLGSRRARVERDRPAPRDDGSIDVVRAPRRARARAGGCSRSRSGRTSMATTTELRTTVSVEPRHGHGERRRAPERSRPSDERRHQGGRASSRRAQGVEPARTPSSRSSSPNTRARTTYCPSRGADEPRGRERARHARRPPRARLWPRDEMRATDRERSHESRGDRHALTCLVSEGSGFVLVLVNLAVMRFIENQAIIEGRRAARRERSRWAQDPRARTTPRWSSRLSSRRGKPPLRGTGSFECVPSRFPRASRPPAGWGRRTGAAVGPFDLV